MQAPLQNLSIYRIISVRIFCINVESIVIITVRRCCLFVSVMVALCLLAGCQNTQEVGDQTSPSEENISHTTPVINSTATPTPAPVKPKTPTPTPSATPNLSIAYNKYIEASLLEHAGDYDAASNAYMDAYQANSNSALICASAANALLHSGMVNQALQMAQRAVGINPELVDGYRVLARVYLALQNRNKAIEQYEIMTKLQPDSVETLLDLANSYMKVQRFNDAVPLFRSILQKQPLQSFIYRMPLALLLFNLQRYEESLHEYQILKDELPDSFLVHLQIGTVHQLLEQYDEALESFLTAMNYIHSTQDELSVRKKLGQLYQIRGSFQEAVYQYQKIKDAAPEDISSRKTLAVLLADQNQDEAALLEAHQLLEMKPDDYNLQQLPFVILQQSGKEAEAYQYLLNTFEQQIQHKRMQTVDAYLWDFMQEDFLDNIHAHRLTQPLYDLLLKSKNLPGQHTRIYAALASFNAKFGKDVELQQNLNDILALLHSSVQERNVSIVEMVCFDLLNGKQIRDSFQKQHLNQSLKEALRLNSNTFLCQSMPDLVLGALAVDAGDWFAAEEAYNHALLRQTPGSSQYKDTLFQLVWAYDKLDRVADVETSIENAFQQYPESAQFYNFLGYMYAERNIHLEEAMSLIEKSLKLEPDDPNILDSMGWVYYRFERYGEALKWLKKAEASEEEHPVISEHLGDVFHKLGDRKSALHYWEKALNQGANFPSEFTADVEQRLKMKIGEVEKNT